MKLDIKKHLKDIVWDYTVSQNTLWDIFLGHKRTFSLNQTKLRARLLLSTPWYSLIDTFGIDGTRNLLNDETIQAIHDKDTQNKFLTARKLIQYAA